MDKRYISNSILKYQDKHVNFSLIILELLGSYILQSKSEILKKKQYYIDLYKPVLNLKPSAASFLGFIHTKESKKLRPEFRKGKPISDKTKLNFSKLFSSKLNPI